MISAVTPSTRSTREGTTTVLTSSPIRPGQTSVGKWMLVCGTQASDSDAIELLLLGEANDVVMVRSNWVRSCRHDDEARARGWLVGAGFVLCPKC